MDRYAGAYMQTGDASSVGTFLPSLTHMQAYHCLIVEHGNGCENEI